MTRKQIEWVEQLRKLQKEGNGIIKTSQMTELHMDYSKIQSLVDHGLLVRLKNGYYALEEENMSEEDMIAGLYEDCVLTLDSALYYYGYLKRKPYAYHIAVNKNTSKSRFKLDYPMVNPYYLEPEALYVGTKEAVLGKNKMYVYSKERLICDCLKYEGKMERSVLQQGLRGYIDEPDKDIQKLMEYAYDRKVTSKVKNILGVWL